MEIQRTEMKRSHRAGSVGADQITCIASSRHSNPRQSQATASHPSTESSSIGRSPLYVSHTASITNKVSNSSAKRRAPHQISPQFYSSTAFASPPFPSRPGMSTPIDPRSKGLLANNLRQTLGKRTEQSQRVLFIVRHPAMTTD